MRHKDGCQYCTPTSMKKPCGWGEVCQRGVAWEQPGLELHLAASYSGRVYSVQHSSVASDHQISSCHETSIQRYTAMRL